METFSPSEKTNTKNSPEKAETFSAAMGSRRKESLAKAANLAQYGNLLVTACDEAEKWVKRNGDLVRNEQEGLLKDLRQARRVLRKCEKSAQKNISVGVFGPSQAGKSYLVSILGKGESDKLWARMGDEKLDFVEEINPTGGEESTGLVTRFTMTKPDELPEGHPVQLKLLTEMDLVKLIANAYYADFDHKEKRRCNMEAALEELKKRAGNPNKRISLDDMEDLREYLNAEFGSKVGVADLERGYWTDAFALAPKLSLEDRVRLYSIIWDEVKEFNDVMLRLLKALDSLDYAETLFCSLDTLTPREKSIIDVKTMKKLGETEEDLISVCTPEGQKLNLPRPVITALTAELIIVMDEKPADYFEHTDLLDFPGYRSRRKLNYPHEDLADKGKLFEVLLRGKVAYLFQRYCADRELNNMLLCIPPSNQEVQDLPSVINAWIASTHGETPEERQDKAVSLFFILTKMDTKLEFVPGEPDVSGRWDTVLRAGLLDFFGLGYDWPTKWTPQRGFDNIFLLRNTKFSCELMSYEGSVETGINPNRADLARQLEKAFMESARVQEHFQNPQKAWDELIRFNDGGITYIRESLAPLCDPEIKHQQLLQNMLHNRGILLRHLNKFYQTDDKEELRQQKTDLAYDLWDRLYDLESVKHGMGELIHSFTVRDSDIYDMYPEAVKRYREYKEEQEEIQKQEALKKSQAPGARRNRFKDAEEGKSPQQDSTSPQIMDEETFFADFIEKKWVQKMSKLADDADAQNYFNLTPQNFSALVSELAKGSARLGFKEQLAKTFKDISSYANTGKDTIVRKWASVAAQTFNDYVDLLGVNRNAENDEERSVTSQDGETHIVFKPKKVEGKFPDLPEKRSQYMNNWFGDWSYALGNLIMENVNFDGTQTLNVAENTALGNILSKFRTEVTDMA